MKQWYESLNGLFPLYHSVEKFHESESRVYPYVINPYLGCQHNCSYCYARFMKRFSGHHEPWDQFVEE